MDKKKIIITIILIAVIIGSLIVFFYPKKMVIGGLRGGPIGPSESAYLEEYGCLGFKRDFCPPWPDYGCDLLCYGITYNKKCSTHSFDSAGQNVKSPINCR